MVHFDQDWKPPDDHPLTMEEARRLLAGDLGDICREILRSCCAPFYWRRASADGVQILGSGTITFAKTAQRLVGVTADHVVKQYLDDAATASTELKIFNAALSQLDLIDRSERLDLATVALSDNMMAKIGKTIVPMSLGRQRRPMEGRGVMIAGYPRGDLIEGESLHPNWGLCTILGIARRVTEEQITWVAEPEHAVQDSRVSQIPSNYSFGGLSGGPLVGLFETDLHLVVHELSGIVSQAHGEFQNIVAKRTEFIRPDGTIREPSQ